MPKPGRPSLTLQQRPFYPAVMGTRRGAGGWAGFSPRDISGLNLWVSADERTSLFQDSTFTTPVTASAQPVGGWQDLSGNGNHVIQAVAAARPTYQTAQANNGLAVVRFDGDDDRLARTVALRPLAVIIVVKRLTAVSVDRFWSLNASQGAGLFDLSGVFAYYSPQVSYGMPSTVFSIVSTVFESPTVAKGYVNGSLRATFDPDPDYSNGGLTVLGGVDDAGIANSNCDITEYLHYNRVLGDAERLTLERYLGRKWGIAVA